ncbi:hypothetical protein NU195Hw_g3677t1 [Hortaea werneckii]
MEKRGGMFERQDGEPLRKRLKRKVEDNNDRFTWPGQTSSMSCFALVKKVLTLLAVLRDVDNQKLPIQTLIESARSKSELRKPRYAYSSRLPYVEPAPPMSTDTDDVPVSDASVTTGPSDDQEADTSLKEIRKMLVDLQAQLPAYREELEATEAVMEGDTESNKDTALIVLDIIGIIVRGELYASAIRRKHLDLACKELRSGGAPESRVKETEVERERQDEIHASAEQLRVWKEKMQKIWGTP